MFNVAILDDNEAIAKRIERITRESLDNAEISVYHNPTLLKNKVSDGRKYQLYLLDIALPEINGMELAELIRELDKDAIFIFITSFSEFAVRGYDIRIRARHYILKSNLDTELGKALEQIRQEMEAKDIRCYLFHRAGYAVRLMYREILYVVKQGKNMTIVTDNGEYTERKTLEEFMKEARSDDFIYIERGHIVNLRHVDKIVDHGRSAVMGNGTTLPISRSQMKQVMHCFLGYWRNNI